MKKIGIFGSTGSIGRSCLEVVRNNPDRISVSVLTANKDSSTLIAQAEEFRPDLVVILDPGQEEVVKKRLNPIGIKVLSGEAGLTESAAEPYDFMIGAITGFAGLKPTLQAIRSGKNIGLANKETLVAAGEIVVSLAEKHGVRLIPIDSEHSAIFQCLMGEDSRAIEQLTLTASGGPFLNRPQEAFDTISRDDALNHPTWNMGAKITIDSATLMNKGLEVIEAHWMFGIDFSKIQVVVHPQSIVHSMVTFSDGSVKAQLGLPDMKVPIQFALSYPDRWPSQYGRVDFSEIGTLNFTAPDKKKFRCLEIAYESGRLGGTAPAVLNAANEEAVHLFLEERIRFTDIPSLLERVLERHSVVAARQLEDIIEADAWARSCVKQIYKDEVSATIGR